MKLICQSSYEEGETVEFMLYERETGDMAWMDLTEDFLDDKQPLKDDMISNQLNLFNN